MIEYDYLIERDEGDEKKIFKPNLIPQKLKNITYIEGPNSSGKSTLLNILALGFYGLKNKKMNPALHDKLNSLISSSHQKLKFCVKITNKDGSISLIAEKPDIDKSDIVIKEISDKGKKSFSRETFEKKYNLIYDIPDNPTERLSQMILDVKDAQVRYGHEVGMLKETVRRVISDIRSARNPERIKFLQGQLDKSEGEKDICSNEIEDLSKQLDILEDYTYCRFYDEYKTKLSKIESKLNNLSKEKVKCEKKIKRENNAYYSNLRIARITIRNMQDIFDDIGSMLNLVLPTDKKYLLKIWERIDLNQALDDLEFDEALEESIISFKKILNERREEIENSESSKEAQMCTDLITVLGNYTNLKLNIPGLEKTIQEFLQDLGKIAEKHKSTLKLIDNIGYTDEQLEKLRRCISSLNVEYFPTLMKLKPYISHHVKIDTVGTTSIEKEKLQGKLNNCQNNFEYYDAQYSAKRRPSIGQIESKAGGMLDEYYIYTEDQLRGKIKDINDKMNRKIADKKSIFHKYTSLSGELERLKSKKPHKYQNQIEILSELFKKLNQLDAKLKNEYSNYLAQIEKKDVLHSISDEQKKYNEVVFTFLGNKLGRFIHIDKEYKAIKVDLIQGLIYTKEKKIIHLSDMGTGQSQSAYLSGLLNTSDKRMIIAMFDEVAMMDNRSLEPIYSRFKELYEEGRLLIGIIVQRAEKIKILSKIE